MAKLKDVVAYILQRYQFRSELSNARVTKMVYLADWKHVLDNGRQISEISWYFDNYGPFVWDVMEVVRDNASVFKVEETANMYGSSKTLFALNDQRYSPQLQRSELAALDHVMDVTKSMNFRDFINFVYSTYPILASERYSHLNLQKLAQAYKRSPLYDSVAG